MSRSHKKHRWRNGMPLGDDKRYANCRVRNTSDVPSGSSYKKLFFTIYYRDNYFHVPPRGASPGAYKDWIK